MELLNKDEFFSLAIHLDLPDLLRLCSSNKIIQQKLCGKDEIWLYKLEKDFPNYRILNIENKSKKEIYELLYSLTILKHKLNIKQNVYHLYTTDKLGVVDKNLSEIPKELGLLINLRILHLSFNHLKKIPEELGSLTKLHTLYLSHNELEKIPKEIGNLVNLRVLVLNDNKLLEIPKEFGNLINLSVLQLSNNKLTQLPKEIGNLKNLRRLELSNNEIKEIPEDLLKNYNLKITK